MCLLWGSFADKIVELHIPWCCVAPRKDRHAGTGDSKLELVREETDILMFPLSVIGHQKGRKNKLSNFFSTKT
jgi:hypothetical protein